MYVPLYSAKGIDDVALTKKEISLSLCTDICWGAYVSRSGIVGERYIQQTAQVSPGINN